MLHYDPSLAECFIFTYKEGMLSAIAHDLKIGVTAFTIQIDEKEPAIQATIDASSLRVLNAMKSGSESPDKLSNANKREIEGNIVKDVLHTKRYPEITFVSSSVIKQKDRYVVKGALTLHGRKRSITFAARREEDRIIAEVMLDQPAFGIKPYTAMLGTLRVKPDILIQVSLPIDELAWEPGEALKSGASADLP
ncbi:MAG: YceI family protein [Candidatus Tectomicrobia bacterium]|nr:YceI family protein [Candidatus Tectomicrobia bacterium]